MQWITPFLSDTPSFSVAWILPFARVGADTQYILEAPALDPDKENKRYYLDSGRIDVIDDKPLVRAEEVQGERKGGIYDYSFYPSRVPEGFPMESLFA